MAQAHATYKGKYIIKVLGGYKIQGERKVYRTFTEAADSI